MADEFVVRFPLDNIDQARRTLECLAATAAVALQRLNKPDVTEQESLFGARRLFDMFNKLVDRERRIVGVCGLPRFGRDGEPAAHDY
jgi:hypothetical protein